MELDKKRPYDHYKDGHVGGGTNAKDSKCIVPLRLKVDKNDKKQGRKGQKHAQHCVSIVYPLILDDFGGFKAYAFGKRFNWLAQC